MKLEDATEENYYAWLILGVVWSLVGILFLYQEMVRPSEQILFDVNIRVIMIIILLGGAIYLFVMVYKYRKYHRQSTEER